MSDFLSFWGFVLKHRVVLGYITFVFVVGIVVQIHQEQDHDNIFRALDQSCLALQGNVEAQRIALSALIRIYENTYDATAARELPYFRLALASLADPRCVDE